MRLRDLLAVQPERRRRGVTLDLSTPDLTAGILGVPGSVGVQGADAPGEIGVQGDDADPRSDPGGPGGSPACTNDPDSRAAYFISYQKGSVSVGMGMRGFSDFLSHLQRLNPAVDLSSFRDTAWLDPRARASDRGRTDVTRLIRGALFPLFVVILLVYLASQTFLGR